MQELRDRDCLISVSSFVEYAVFSFTRNDCPFITQCRECLETLFILITQNPADAIVNSFYPAGTVPAIGCSSISYQSLGTLGAAHRFPPDGLSRVLG